MKEGVKNRILAASRDKVNKLNDLKNRQTINDTEYNDAVQAINSQAKLQANQIDTQFAQTILGSQNQLISLREKAAVSNATLIPELAKTLGLSAEQVGLISKYIDPNKTAAENQAAILKVTQDPNSDISKAQEETRKAAVAQAQAELQSKYDLNQMDNQTKITIAEMNNALEQGRINVEQYKAETTRAIEKFKTES